MSERPVPAALAKRGLTQISDNIPPGYELKIDAGVFVSLFRTELEALLIARPDPKPVKTPRK